MPSFARRGLLAASSVASGWALRKDDQLLRVSRIPNGHDHPFQTANVIHRELRAANPFRTTYELGYSHVKEKITE